MVVYRVQKTKSGITVIIFPIRPAKLSREFCFAGRGRSSRNIYEPASHAGHPQSSQGKSGLAQNPLRKSNAWRVLRKNRLDFFNARGGGGSISHFLTAEINALNIASLSLPLASMTCMQRFYFSDIWQLVHIYHAYVCKLPRQTVLCHLQQKQVSCSLPPPPLACSLPCGKSAQRLFKAQRNNHILQSPIGKLLRLCRTTPYHSIRNNDICRAGSYA